jgi:hypothetical protein
MHSFKNVLISTLATALVLVAFPAAAVVGSWSTPVNLTDSGGYTNDPQVTVSSTGLVTAVWTRNNGSHDIIQSSTSQSGGAWSPPVNLSASGEDSDDPQVTVSSAGLATAVWYRDNGSNYIIQSSTSQNGGAWSPPVNLSAAGRDAYDPQVTVSSTGLATAVWYRWNGSNDIIQSSRSLNGGAWSAPADLSATGGDAYEPQVTVSSTGLVTAIWYRYEGSAGIIQSRTSQNGGAWSDPEDLSATGSNAYDPQVTVSSTGLATAVWYRFDGSNNIIQSSTSLNGDAWSDPVDLSAIGGDAYDPQVTVSSTGLVTAVWTRDNGSHDIIQSSTPESDGDWSTPEDLSATGGDAGDPQVTVSSTGLVTAVWTRDNGSDDIIQSSTSESGGAWSTPVDLSATGGDDFDPQVTVSSTGLATAVWTRWNGSHDVIQSSTSQNGGAWSTPVDLSATGEDAFDPQVTVSSTGLVTAVWTRNNGSHDIIQSSTSQSGGAWSPPEDLSATGEDSDNPQVTVSSAGLATAVWYRDNGSNYIIQSRTSQNGGAWSPPADLSAPGRDAYDPQITVSSTGLVTAVWFRYDGSNNIIQSRTSLNGGAWSTPADLSATGGDAYETQVTVSSTGLVTAIWYRYDGSHDIIQSRTSQNGGAWSAPEDLSATGANAYDPQVTVSSTGLATAVWTRWNGSHNIIQSSTSQNGGAWSAPVDLSATGGDAGDPQVTVSSTGLVTAVWYRYDGSNNIIQSSTPESGGAWSTPEDLSATGGSAYEPQVTVSSTGLVTAVWTRDNGSHDVLQSSTLSNSTPTTLAATGAEVQWLALGSLIAVVAGASFLTVSRRKRTA